MSQGIDIREPSTLIVEEALRDADGALITTGTATVIIAELQADGSYRTFDFNDNTFKSTTVTTLAANMTHRQLNNGAKDTGDWTYVQSIVAGFTAGRIYKSIVEHADLVEPIERKFQWGIAAGSFDRFADKVDVVDAPNANAVAVFQDGLATAAALGTPTDGSIAEDIANLQAEFDAGVDVATIEGNDGTDYFDAMITAIRNGLATATNVTDATTPITAAITALQTKILRWFRLALRSDAAVATDHAAELAEINANTGTAAGDYAPTSDSDEARADAIAGIEGGGEVNVQFTPISSNVSAGDVVGDHFAAFVGAAGSVTIVVTSEGSLPDLTGVDLEFIVEPLDAVADKFIKTSAAGDVAAGGPDGNQVTVLWLKTDFTAIGTYQYALIEPRPDDDDRLWARGTVTVERIAIRDA